MSILDKKTFTQELKEKRKINKIVLGFFLFIVVSTLLMKIVDSILLDLGYGIDGKTKFHMYYWINIDYLKRMTDDSNLKNMIQKHPHTFWFMTQFTWLTTIIIIVVLTFRFFKYDGKMPRWLRWIMTQRTLSLVVIYDIIMAVVFWSSMYQGFLKNFSLVLKEFQLTYTIFVHAIIPILMATYSLIFLIYDDKASTLKEMTIWKGMIYPIIYFFSYVLIAYIWQDPYFITNLKENFIINVWKLLVIILSFLIMISLMILIHNFILIKFNKQYNPKWDYEHEKENLKYRKNIF